MKNIELEHGGGIDDFFKENFLQCDYSFERSFRGNILYLPYINIFNHVLKFKKITSEIILTFMGEWYIFCNSL